MQPSQHVQPSRHSQLVALASRPDICAAHSQSYMCVSDHTGEYDLFSIEISKSYGANEWREDLKKVCGCCYCQG